MPIKAHYDANPGYWSSDSGEGGEVGGGAGEGGGDDVDVEAEIEMAMAMAERQVYEVDDERRR